MTYDKGLDRYYGLVDLAVDAGIFVKAGNRVAIPDGTKLYPKAIYSKPEKYFTGEIMDNIEIYVNKEFKYGHIIEEEGETEEISDELTESLAIIDSEVE